MRFDLSEHTTVRTDGTLRSPRVFVEPVTDDRPADSINVICEDEIGEYSIVIATSELQQAIGFCKDAANAKARRIAANAKARRIAANA